MTLTTSQPTTMQVSCVSQQNHSFEERLMADIMNPEFVAPTNSPAQPELLVSAVLHLMSHYTANHHEPKSCVKLASVIERHLKALADLPNLAPVLRATCLQLSEQWANVVETSMPRPEKFNLFSRLVTGVKAV
jgi:hypothetical protein